MFVRSIHSGDNLFSVDAAVEFVARLLRLEGIFDRLFGWEEQFGREGGRGRLGK